MDRDCYYDDGTCKKGAHIVVRSHHYEILRADLAATERVLQKRRARSQGNLANRIIPLGNKIGSKQLMYTAFQKNFGRSTKVRAAGALVALLRRKAERAGGELVDLNTWRLKLSQYDQAANTCT